MASKPSPSRVTRPIMRYHGGKWRIAPWIIDKFPPHRIYCEVFGGAASTLLRKERSYSEVYNDLDDEIVNVFRVLRNQPAKLIQAMTLTPFSRTEYRKSFRHVADPVERARRMIVRSMMGHGSISVSRKAMSGFRGNSHRSHVPAQIDWLSLPPALWSVVDRFRGVVIENRDYRKILRIQDSPQTLFYLDPPYPHSTPSTKHAYLHEMTVKQHCRMRLALTTLQGMVVVSSYPSKLYDDLYDGWERHETDSLADGARKRVEVVYLNPAASEARRRRNPSLFAERGG